MLFDGVGQAVACDGADPGTGLLDSDLEREHKDRSPQLTKTKLGAGLAVGRDTRGVIVGRTGDEAGTKDFEKLGDW